MFNGLFLSLLLMLLGAVLYGSYLRFDDWFNSRRKRDGTLHGLFNERRKRSGNNR